MVVARGLYTYYRSNALLLFLFLAVILFHNDEEIVTEQIEHMIKNKHDIIIFNHNSNDKTQELIEIE